MSTNQTTDVALPTFSDDQLREIDSFQAAIDLATEAYGGIDDAAESIGNGFEILKTEHKSRLVDVAFVILDWRFYQGDKGPAVAARLVTERGEKLIINDGSSGIRDQLRKYTAANGVRALGVRHGLTRSDYDYTDPNTGEVSRATTYYLNTSK